MQLTKFSDYAIRVLIYTEYADPNLVTIDEITKIYGISRAHLMKVVNSLTKSKFLTAVRGRNGGIRLARPASEINLGDVIKSTEPNFAFVQCLEDECDCKIVKNCKFKNIMYKAKIDFLNAMSEHSLKDIALDELDFDLQSPVSL